MFTLPDKEFPIKMEPVVLIKKVSPAVIQIYNMSQEELHKTNNHFECVNELLNSCVFLSDTVLDTTLNGMYMQIATV